VTGYEGVLGERFNNGTAGERQDSIDRATVVAEHLKATGWLFASHSYGHIDFARDPVAVTRRDIDRWKAVVEPVVGATDLFIFPFGARPPLGSATMAMLRDEGFTILCDIDIAPRITRVGDVAVMARRHIDGLALEQQRNRLLPFFDAATVEDPAARNGRA
jgi:peptidoglycan/xylan/chitin deacetylase (PgdA/CDA1 family)